MSKESPREKYTPIKRLGMTSSTASENSTLSAKRITRLATGEHVKAFEKTVDEIYQLKVACGKPWREVMERLKPDQ